MSEQPRVALCGESVAAGYLLAPALTPARALETFLGWRLQRPAQVLDLARTNERSDGLVAGVAAACERGAELVVLFAGNNWALLEAPELSPLAPSAGYRRQVGELLAGGGLEALVNAAVRRVLERVVTALDRIRAITAEARCAVLVVVPEVNLADWSSWQPTPWLSDTGAGRWHRLLHRVTRRLDEGDLVGAVRSARSMVVADRQLTPTPLHLMGEARRLQGESALASWALREAVDRSSYPLAVGLPAPQCATWAAELLRRFALDHGWRVVDLPRLLAIEGTLPGRELFFDYCHLTEVGVGRVILEVARVAAEVLEGRAQGDGEPPDGPALPLAAEDLARARLGAALHNAHRYLGRGKEEILRHWTMKALEASPRIVETMLDVAEVRTAGGDPDLSRAAPRNRRAATGLERQHGWRYQHLDAQLLALWMQVLVGADPSRRDALSRRVRGRLEVGREWRELATQYFLWEPLSTAYPDLLGHDDLPERAFLRAIWPSTELCLVTPGPKLLEISATFRLAAMPRTAGGRRGRVGVELDGHRVGTFVVGERWSTRVFRLTVEPSCVPLRRLAFRWPLPPPADGEALLAASSDLAEGLEAWIHPAFGDLYSVRAREV